MTDVALIIKIDSSDVGKATIALDKLAKEGVQTEVATKSLTSATGSLMAAVKNAAAAFGLYKLGGLISESAQLNARFETMGIVMNGVGFNAGYSANQMAGFETALRKTGISMIESRENITKMAQAQLDLTKASELARVAQDAAVIGGINSSEAFARMVHGIQAGQTETLRTIGINVDFQQSYAKLAKELNTTSKNLDETQKAQARMNAVIEYGTRIAGTYENAMGTAGKQMSSMKRYVEDLKVKLGETFNEGLTIAIFGFSDALKDANKEADSLSNNGSLKEWGRETIAVLTKVGDVAVGVAGGIRMTGLAARVLVEQAKTLTKPGGLKEMKELEAMYQAEEKKWLKSLGGMSRSADKYFTDKDAKQQASLNKDKNYIKELAELRVLMANESLKSQQAANKMLTDLYYPEPVAGPKPKTNAGGTEDGASKKAASAYASLIKASKDYAQSLKEETEAIGLNSEQVRMLEAARAAAKAPTDALKLSIMQNAQTLSVATIAEDAQKKALEATEKALKEVQAEREKYLETLASNADAAEKALEQMLIEEEALTVSEEKHITLSLAIEEVNLQRLEEQRILEILNGNDIAVATIQREIDARKKLLTLLGNKEVRDLNAKAAKDASDEWQKTSDDIERSLMDALMRGFEGGKDFAANFAATLKNMFSTLVLRPLIQPIAQAGASLVTGALGMGASGSAAASGGTAGSSGLGNLLSLGGAASSYLGSLGTMAAYGSAAASGGLIGAATQGGMLAAQTGAFGAFGAASTSTALGGAAAAGGGLAGTVAAAIPVIGWVIAAIGLIAAFAGKKESSKAQFGISDLETGLITGQGGFSGKKFSQENRDTALGMAQAGAGWAETLRLLGGEIAGSLAIEVGSGSRGGFRANIGNDQTSEVYGSDPAQFMADLFDALTESAGGLDPVIKDLLIGFEGTAEEMANFAGALVLMRDFMDADPFAEAMQQIEDAGRSTWQIWQNGEGKLRDLAASFDGSLGNAQELATATYERYQQELSLIGQIQGLLLSTSAMFGNSIEQITLSVMDQSQKYDYWRTQTDEAYAALLLATDPAEIARLSGRINQGATSAYSLLDETQRSGAADEFISYLTTAGEVTTERLEAAQATIIQNHQDIAAVIKGALESAAATMLEAANAQLNAANTPVVVDVNVTVDNVGSELGIGQQP